MRWQNAQWLALWALVVVPLRGHARVTDAFLQTDARPLFAIAEPFGFSESGRVEITLTSLGFYGRVPDKQTKPVDVARNNMGFILANADADALLELKMSQVRHAGAWRHNEATVVPTGISPGARRQGKCPVNGLDNTDVKLFSMDDPRIVLDGVTKNTYNATMTFDLKQLLQSFTGGRYSLYFVNCNEVDHTSISAELQVLLGGI